MATATTSRQGPYNFNIWNNRSRTLGPAGNRLTGNVFVDPRGSDVGDGSQESPFASLARAVAVADAGDTIYVAPGTYTEDLVVAKRVEIVGFDRRGTIIRSETTGGRVIDFAAGAADSVLRNLTVRADDNIAPGAPAECVRSAVDIEVEDCVFATEAGTVVGSTGINVIGGVARLRRTIINFEGNFFEVGPGGQAVFDECEMISPGAITPARSTITAGPGAAGPADNATVTIRNSVIQHTLDGAIIEAVGGAAGAIASVSIMDSELFNARAVIPTIAGEGLLINVQDGGANTARAFLSRCQLRPLTFLGDTYPAGATFLIGTRGGGGSGGVVIIDSTRMEFRTAASDIINEGDAVLVTTGDGGLNGGAMYRNGGKFDGAGAGITEAVGVGGVWGTRAPRTLEETVARIADQLAKVTDTVSSAVGAGAGVAIVATREEIP